MDFEIPFDLAYKNWRACKICTFDIETNGFDPSESLMWQFGAVTYMMAYNEMIELSRKEIIFDIGEENIEGVINLTNKKGKKLFEGLTPEVFENATSLEQGLHEIKDYFEEAELINGHNIIGFDIPFINYNFAQFGIEPIDKPPIDTIIWYRHTKNKMGYGTNLSAACKDYAIAIMGAVAHGEVAMHDAMSDVKASNDLLWAMSKRDIDCFTVNDLLLDQSRYHAEQIAWEKKKYGSKE